MARKMTADFSFGDVEFRRFAPWLLDQYRLCVDWIDSGLDKYSVCVQDAGLPTFEPSRVAVLRAYDSAYLAMLALAVKHSVQSDLIDGALVGSVEDVVVAEPFRRARYMLNYHAKSLPVAPSGAKGTRESPSLYDQRAALAAGPLSSLAASGFDSADPMCRWMLEQLPPLLREAWEAHEHRDEPLCQFMIASFHLTFRHLVPADDDRYWKPVLDVFWPQWTEHFLDFYIAVEQESPEAS